MENSSVSHLRGLCVPSGMDDRSIEQLRDRVTFISGSSKNSGKTTFLNYLLPRFRKEGDFAFLTIGIDGERKDQIYGTDKPLIETVMGDYLITSEQLMNKSDAQFEVLQVFPWKSVLGKMVFLKTKRSGLIELAGPENNDQLGRMIDYIRRDCRISTILIDGAINRITQIASIGNAGFYFVSRITPDNYQSSLNKLRVLWDLSKQDSAETISDREAVHYHHGAFTLKNVIELDDSCEAVVLDDFTKVFLDDCELQRFLKTRNLYFMNTIELVAFVFNLYDVDREKVLADLDKAGIKGCCIFNPYVRNEGVDSD